MYSIAVCCIAWTIAQVTKIVLRFIHLKEWNWELLFSSGGFPSAHSAFVSCLAVQIAITEGVNSSIFALAFAFACVVIYDSFGVRYAVGIHGQAINRLQTKISDMELNIYEQDGELNKPVKEVLGHTPFQVLCGIILGIIIGLLRFFIF